MKNVMFKDTPIPKPSRGAFDLSFESKLSCQIGELVPFLWYDVVPGDQFNIRSEILCKFSPMLAPVLHRIDLYAHYFYVPYRLLMNPVTDTYAGWKDFITGDPDGLYTNETLPYITISNANKAYFVESTLANYLGLPYIATGTTVSQDIDINALPFFAYHLIYDDYFRDEALVDRITGPNASVGDIALIGGDRNTDILHIAPTSCHKRAYEKDYFKGALATAYTGASTDVELDLDSTWDGSKLKWVDSIDGGVPVVGDPTFDGVDNYMQEAGTGRDIEVEINSSNINTTLEVMELRRVLAITRWLEAERRGGTRYNEMILGIWGITPDNAELDYPQYIGGGRQAVQVSSVLNQSQVLDPTAGVNDGAGGVTVTVDPQSLETGRGFAYNPKNQASVYVKEHGIVMGILSVLPRTAYGGAQIEKFWRKADREDFFLPQLQNIGDQSILQSEIGYDATGSDADNVFGYAPRWAEYKFKNSFVAGAFLSTLDYWHMAEIGDTSGAGPDLNQAYIECGYLEDNNVRIFADQTTEDHLFLQIYNDVFAKRPMQVFDVPR